MYLNNLRNLFMLLAVLGTAFAAPQRGGNNNSNAGNNANAGNDANAGNGANEGNNNNNNNNNNGGGNRGTTLLAANVQDASASDGGADVEEGQSPSETDTANFINFCSGKTTTNGLQNTAGSCNGVVMGDIPSQNNMISSIITNPGPGDNIQANTDFEITVQTTNLVAGTFTNPDNTYYAAPQQLQGGKVIGHTHITVQDLGNSLAPNNPPNPGVFAFFKGINDNGNGQGELSATVTGGLPAGNYRVCTMTSSSNHQPVLMPVAQRGAQDDCQKFTVGGNGGNAGNNAGAGANNNNAGNNNNNNNAAGGNNAGNGGNNNNNAAAGGNNNAGQGEQGAQAGQAGQNEQTGRSGGRQRERRPRSLERDMPAV